MTDLAQLRRRVEEIRRWHTNADRPDDITDLLAYADAATRLLREADDLFYYNDASGWSDKWGMRFYHETGVWPLFKSMPAEMHGAIRDETGEQFQRWIDGKRRDLFARVRQLCGPDETGEG